MRKAIHRVAPIYCYVFSFKTACYRSCSNRLLVRVSVHSVRAADIPYIYPLGSRLDFSVNQIGEPSRSPTRFPLLTSAPCPRTSSRPSVLSSLARASPECTSSSHLTSSTDDEAHRWTDSPVLYVHKFLCISGSIEGTRVPQKSW